MSAQSINVTVSFTVNPSALSFAPATLPPATVGTVYPATSIGIVSGGTSPYTFTVTAGMPPGMTLSANGMLSGTPTTAGSYTIDVTITDSTP